MNHPRAGAASRGRRRRRRSIVIVRRIVLGILLTIIIGIAAIIVRLIVSPMPVNFLVPHLEELPREAGLDVRVGDAELRWNTHRGTLEVRVRDIAVGDLEGNAIGVVPSVDLALSMPALLRKVVAPTSLRVTHLALDMSRDADGGWRLVDESVSPDSTITRSLTAEAEPEPAHPDSGDATGGLSTVLPIIIDHVLAAPDLSQPLTYLKRVELGADRIAIDDEMVGEGWAVEGIDLVLRHGVEALSGDLEFEAPSHGGRAKFVVQLKYDPSGKTIDFQASISDLWQSSIAPVLPYSNLVRTDFPVQGSLQGTIDTDARLQDLEFDLTEQGGTLQVIGVIGIQGRATARVDSVDAVVNVTIDTVQLDRLDELWPPELAGDVRDQVAAAVQQGTLTKVTARASVSWPVRSPQEVELDAVTGKIEFTDLAVKVKPKLSIAEGITGTATFDLDTVRVEVPLATVGPIAIRDLAGCGKTQRKVDWIA